LKDEKKIRRRCLLMSDGGLVREIWICLEIEK
jgi:hypothetical protein